MAILSVNEPGVLLTARFDAKTPNAKAELEAFKAAVAKLQQRVGGSLIHSIERRADGLTVRVVAAVAPKSKPTKAKPKGQPVAKASPRGKKKPKPSRTK